MTTAPKGSIPIPWHTWWPAIRGPCLAWHHNIGMTLQHWHDTTCSSGMYRCVKKIKTLNTSQNRAATQPNCIWRMQFKPTMCRRQIIKNNDCVCKNICSKNTHIRTHTHTQSVHKPFIPWHLSAEFLQAKNNMPPGLERNTRLCDGDLNNHLSISAGKNNKGRGWGWEVLRPLSKLLLSWTARDMEIS